MLSHSASDEDIKQVDDWREASPENEKVYQEYAKTWQVWDNYSQILAIDTHKATKKLERKLRTTTAPQKIGLAYAYVASILLPLLIVTSVYFYLNQSSTPEFVPPQRIVTAYGLRKQVMLPDSSVVWLNAGSSLEFPMAFTKDRREVTLTGEAFFDVVKDPKHPFYVKVENMYVKVLGTEFNVQAYPDDERIVTTLLSGSVQLVQKRGSEEKILAAMKPDQHIIFNKKARNLELIDESEEAKPAAKDQKHTEITSTLPSIDAKVEANKHTAWIAGKLVFRDDSMEEIARRLGRWYNVDITLNSELLKEYSYTATFTDETLEQVLELLKLTAPMEYTIREREKLDETTFDRKEVIIDVKR